MSWSKNNLAPGLLLTSAPLSKPQDIDRMKAEKKKTDVHYDAGPSCGICGAVGIDISTFKGCPMCPAQTPRQLALSSGAKWYAPTAPCKNCLSVAQRRVHDGACSACIEESNSATIPASRKDARAAKLRFYRTGALCKRGHAAKRYTSTAACFVCKSVT